MFVDIEKIKVSDRIRKDFGDIEELARDIEQNGLINPIVLAPDYQLVAGERRLRAHQFLKRQQVDARIMEISDYEHQLRLEISENEHRKEFTFSERIEWAKRLEEVERIKAKERMAGRKENFPDHEGGQVRDIVAEQAGFGSGKQYDKAKFIAENATPEIIQQLDAGLISTHKAFIETKNRLEAAVREAEGRAEQAEQEKLELQRMYKDAIPADQLDEAVSEAIERHQEETSLLLTQKEKEKQHLLKQKEEEWKAKYKQEMENSEFVLKNLRDGLKEAQEKIKTLELQQPSDFDEQHEAAKLKKLRFEADINTVQLAVQIKQFLQKVGITSFMLGAVAGANSSEKKRLSESLDMLEAFVEQIRPAVNGRRVVNDHGND
ncbi:ParB N-terminal domain-containing protein [Paenibacillus macerans]|uniref:ParB N-terminal domain-containing protein n=1 Tax=Paenibacillus macerans TaxID=44252 RepID=UPI002DBE6C5C|nr:ParB N-terminal domain-containing protein [Paenibacillus macerans]MEC0140439.1 ParB N-terminal domain-containing protein [Paenibacillus macerans]